jgi:uncharacterized protein YjbI with pentapeptide repeats
MNLDWPYFRTDHKQPSDVMHRGETLASILRLHEEWLADPHNGAQADLSGADLRLVDLRSARLDRANMRGALLQEACLANASLVDADLHGSNLQRADAQPVIFVRAKLGNATLREANLEDALLFDAEFRGADLACAHLPGAALSGARLEGANMGGAGMRLAQLQYSHMRDVDLRGADLSCANLSYCDLRGADARGADLREASLLHANLQGADLTGSYIYGANAWALQLEDVKQADLIITPKDEPEIKVDSIDVAQFIYLLLSNQKIRNVIDTISSRVVLLLGRFSPERMRVLVAIKDELRRNGYVPVVFDFDPPTNRDLTETISTLAHLARFIVADISEPRSVPHELMAIVPSLAVPIVPLLKTGTVGEYAMFNDLSKYPWVLDVFRYDELDSLIAEIGTNLVRQAESRVAELRRGRFGAES